MSDPLGQRFLRRFRQISPAFLARRVHFEEILFGLGQHRFRLRYRLAGLLKGRVRAVFKLADRFLDQLDLDSCTRELLRDRRERQVFHHDLLRGRDLDFTPRDFARNVLNTDGRQLGTDGRAEHLRDDEVARLAAGFEHRRLASACEVDRPFVGVREEPHDAHVPFFIGRRAAQALEQKVRKHAVPETRILERLLFLRARRHQDEPVLRGRHRVIQRPGFQERFAACAFDRELISARVTKKNLPARLAFIDEPEHRLAVHERFEFGRIDVDRAEVRLAVDQDAVTAERDEKKVPFLHLARDFGNLCTNVLAGRLHIALGRIDHQMHVLSRKPHFFQLGGNVLHVFDAKPQRGDRLGVGVDPDQQRVTLGFWHDGQALSGLRLRERREKKDEN